MGSVIRIQIQDTSGVWRTIRQTFNNSQMILKAMEDAKAQYPLFRIRAIDEFDVIVDIL